jgi:tetratricopeptide (TPR) repeat protein
MGLARSGLVESVTKPLGLIEHVVAVTQYALDRQVLLDEAYLLLRVAAEYLMKIGEVEAAVAENRKLLQMAVPAFGQGSPQHGAALCNLAVALGSTGAVEESERLLREAIELSRQAGEERHAELAVQVGNLAMARLSQGDMQGALSLIEEGLSLTPPDRHQDLAVTLAKKARVLGAQGAHEDALPLLDNAARELDQVDNPNLQHWLWVLYERASALLGLRRLTEAREILEEAVRRAEADTGIDSRRTQEALLRLLAVLLLLRDFDAIAGWFERVPGLMEAWQEVSERHGLPPLEPEP